MLIEDSLDSRNPSPLFILILNSLSVFPRGIPLTEYEKCLRSLPGVMAKVQLSAEGYLKDTMLFSTSTSRGELRSISPDTAALEGSAELVKTSSEVMTPSFVAIMKEKGKRPSFLSDIFIILSSLNTHLYVYPGLNAPWSGMNSIMREVTQRALPLTEGVKLKSSSPTGIPVWTSVDSGMSWANSILMGLSPVSTPPE